MTSHTVSREISPASSRALSRCTSTSSVEEPTAYLEEVKIEIEEFARIIAEANMRVGEPNHEADKIYAEKKSRPKSKIVGVNNEYYIREGDFDEIYSGNCTEDFAKKLSVKGIIQSAGMGSAGMDGGKEMNIKSNYDMFGAINSNSTSSGVNSITDRLGSYMDHFPQNNGNVSINPYKSATGNTINSRNSGPLNKVVFKNPRNNSFVLMANCAENAIVSIKSQNGMVELEYSPSVKEISLNFQSQIPNFLKHSDLFQRWRSQQFGLHLGNYHHIAGTGLNVQGKLNEIPQN
ncbi:hypothetical protein BEWA_047720 [Theileria equi strain WA]|uniref:Uncharacterized protein n=1 Tax=Theileria equi strain WA TaxID=1537102 RepID=L1LA45_THEEQ|nr:hypothetical protein BEWA_047720 [Theileria equi strain WA]EKX72307.1 hypothetical protein BEWA_047720 [Theileria equi strain WA]|eukprot:XP_004831759.1 hypothetical protein BEWA_047720 [Theileria equi strain WA]